MLVALLYLSVFILFLYYCILPMTTLFIFERMITLFILIVMINIILFKPLKKNAQGPHYMLAYAMGLVIVRLDLFP